MNAKKVTDCKK